MSDASAYCCLRVNRPWDGHDLYSG